MRGDSGAGGGSLSVVIAARRAERTIRACLDSLMAQDPPPVEVIVVVDEQEDGTADVARALGAEVLELPGRAWPGGARNAGAARAIGSILAFVDADDVVRPGWSAALLDAFDAGADLVDYERVDGGGADLVSQYLRERHSPGHAWNPPWPGALFVQGGWFAVRRALFESLQGFDPHLHAAEDHDFFARAALAGHRPMLAIGAGYEYRPRPSPTAMVRQRAVWAYWRVVLRRKWRRFPFLFLPERRLARRTGMALASAASHAARGDTAAARLELLDAVVLVGTGAGVGLARLAVATGRQRDPSAIEPASHEETNAGGGLPPGPVALLVGDQAAVGALSSALRADQRVGSPPAGMVPSSEARWNAPPPSPDAAVAAANRAGWSLPRGRAASRFAASDPETYGEAVLRLHAIHAWLGRKATWVVSAGGRSGHVAAAHLPSVPIVAIGDAGVLGDRAAVAIGADDLRRHPARAMDVLAPVLGLSNPARVAFALRVLQRADPLTKPRRRGTS